MVGFLSSHNRIDTRNHSGEGVLVGVGHIGASPNESIFTNRIGRNSHDGGLITIAYHIVARHSQRRDSTHGDRLLSNNGRTCNTKIFSRFYCKSIITGLVQVNSDGIKVLTRNFQTIEEPSEVVDFSTCSLNRNLGTNLTTLTKVHRVNIQAQLNSSRVNQIDSNVRSQLTSCRHIRSGIDRRSVSLHRVKDAVTRCTLGKGRISHDRRNAIDNLIVNHPLVGNILVVEANQLGIQHNGAAGTHFNFRSIDLQVAASLPNGELGGSLTTLGGLHRHGIDTGDGGRQHIRGVVLCGVRVRTNPSVGGIFHKRSRHGSGSVLTNHVVTSDGDFGSGQNINRIKFVGNQNVANGVGQRSAENISTDLVHVHADGGKILTRNFNTVHIPCI